MATVTVRELIEALSKCDPEAHVVGYIEHKEYELPIEIVEQFFGTQILERAQEDQVEDGIYPSSPHYTKGYSVVEEEWAKTGKVSSVVYLREQWPKDKKNSSVIYMRKEDE